MFVYRTTLRDLYYDQAMKLYFKEGMSVRHIAKVIPVSKTTISRWIANFAESNPKKVLAMKAKAAKPGPQAEHEPTRELPEDVKTLPAVGQRHHVHHHLVG